MIAWPGLNVFARPLSPSIEATSVLEDFHYFWEETELNWTYPPTSTFAFFPGESALPILTTIESIRFLPGITTERIQIPWCLLTIMI